MDDWPSYIPDGPHMDSPLLTAMRFPSDPPNFAEGGCVLESFLNESISRQKAPPKESLSKPVNTSQRPDQSTSTADLGRLYTCSPIQWEGPGQPINLSSQPKKSSATPENAGHTPNQRNNASSEHPSPFLKSASPTHSPPPTVAGRTPARPRSIAIANSAKAELDRLYEQQAENLNFLENWPRQERAASMKKDDIILNIMRRVDQLTRKVRDKDDRIKLMTIEIKRFATKAKADTKTIEDLRTYKKESDKDELRKKFITLKAMYGELSDEFKTIKMENELLKAENVRLRPFERANVAEYVVFGDVEDGANEGGDTDEETRGKEEQSGTESSEWEKEMA